MKTRKLIPFHSFSVHHTLQVYAVNWSIGLVYLAEGRGRRMALAMLCYVSPQYPSQGMNASSRLHRYSLVISIFPTTFLPNKLQTNQSGSQARLVEEDHIALHAKGAC